MKPQKIALLALAALLSMQGCKPKATASSHAAVSDAKEGRDEFLGTREISGTLYSTKGDQAMIAGVMIEQGFMYEENGSGWKGAFNALRDSQVVAKGDLWRHHCAPGEQCLTQGYIDQLIKVKYLRKAE